MGIFHLCVNNNSKLVVNHVNYEYQAKEDILVRYLNKVGLFMQTFVEVYTNNMPRDQKTKVDEFLKPASMKPLVNTSFWLFKPYKHRPSWRWKCMCVSRPN